jgi:hypothetical protein
MHIYDYANMQADAPQGTERHSLVWRYMEKAEKHLYYVVTTKISHGGWVDHFRAMLNNVLSFH